MYHPPSSDPSDGSVPQAPPVYAPQPYMPGGAPNQYGPPQYGYSAPDPERSSAETLSTVALVLGICGFFFGLIASIPAIFVGVTARRKARRVRIPSSKATAGLWLGVTATVINIVVLALIAIVFLGLFSVISTQAALGKHTYGAVASANAFYAKNDTYVGWKASSYVPSDGSVSKITNSVVTANSVCVDSTEGGTTVHTSASYGATPKGDSSISVGSDRYTWSNGPCNLTPVPLRR